MALPTRYDPRNPYARRIGTAIRDENNRLLRGEQNGRGERIDQAGMAIETTDGRPAMANTANPAIAAQVQEAVDARRAIGRLPQPDTGRGYSPKGSIFNEAFPTGPSSSARSLPSVADARNIVAAARLRKGLPTLEDAEQSAATNAVIRTEAGHGMAVQTPYGTVASTNRPSLPAVAGREQRGPTAKPITPDEADRLKLPGSTTDPNRYRTAEASRPTLPQPVIKPYDPLASVPPKTLTANGRTTVNPMAGAYNENTNAPASRSGMLNLAGANRAMSATTPRSLPQPYAQNELPTAMESSQSSDPVVRAGAPGLSAWERNMEADPLSPRNLLARFRRPRQNATPLKDRIVGSY